jgi:hypothetical protein
MPGVNRQLHNAKFEANAHLSLRGFLAFAGKSVREQVDQRLRSELELVTENARDLESKFKQDRASIGRLIRHYAHPKGENPKAGTLEQIAVDGGSSAEEILRVARLLTQTDESVLHALARDLRRTLRESDTSNMASASGAVEPVHVLRRRDDWEALLREGVRALHRNLCEVYEALDQRKPVGGKQVRGKRQRYGKWSVEDLLSLSFSFDAHFELNVLRRLGHLLLELDVEDLERATAALVEKIDFLEEQTDIYPELADAYSVAAQLIKTVLEELAPARVSQGPESIAA